MQIFNKFKFYTIASNTLAPNSVSYQLENNNKGFIADFLSTKGVTFLGFDGRSVPNIKFLKTYCFEHFNGNFIEETEYISEQYELFNIKCVDDNMSPHL